MAGEQELRERLARLDADQTLKLVTGLQDRINALRAGSAPVQPPPIAVIGLACRFPGAADAAAFRQLLDEGRDAVGAPPAGRPQAATLTAGGYIEAIDRFDAAFFGIRAGEAAHMDPQHRLALEVAWHALEDAGAADAGRRPSATGVFIGISTHDYEARFHAAGQGFTPQAATGNAASAAAGRLAHLLDVTGPALALDTACSSSLVAVHAACRSLRSGECDMAIVGGVNVLVTDSLTRGFADAGMLSPNYACRTFDAAADGYVRGEGAGFVILKRLADARRDGDRIRAVVRGSAVNHDGRASSLTAPNGTAQTALIRSALADAGLRPADIQAVECHGTGTPLGDPIEVQALAEAYAPGRDAPLLLGSVKTNIGHLEAAAGIAGFIKTVLALESASLPTTLHQVRPNPRIAWEKLPLQVVDRPVPWPQGGPRRAGVSSFGFSGTNAHVILEAAEPRRAAEAAAWPLVLPLSAPDASGLSRLAGVLASWLENTDCDPAQAAASVALSCAGFAERAAVAGADAAGLAAGLRELADGCAPTVGARGTAPAAAPKVAFLFTGQGSQWPGMGKDLYDGDSLFRKVVDDCCRVVDPLIGDSLAAIMFDEQRADELADTRLAQPALFVLGYALAERLAAWGVEADAAIGHSLGEWIAACRAGVFTLDDALRLVVARGRLMASVPADGAMAAVFGGPQALSALPAEVREAVDAAAFNAPDECVISGPEAAVAAACEALDGLGVGTQRLRTSHGFHSRLMEPALDAFAAELAGVPLSVPSGKLVSNLTGATDAPFDTAAYWVRHIREPVRFADGMAALAATGASVLIEIGASPALSGCASRCPGFVGGPPIIASTLRRNQPARRTLGALLAQLFAAGVPVRWKAVFDSSLRIDAPGYPFAAERHWLEPAPGSDAPAALVAAQPAASDAGPAAAQAPVDRHRDSVALLARSLQLSLEDAQSDQGFLSLGVDSLALAEAVAALERRWSMAIPRRELFETLATPARLIAHVVAAGQGASASSADATAETISSAAADTGVGGSVPAVSQAVSAPPAAASSLPVVAPFSAEAAAGVAAFAGAYVRRSAASREERRRFGRFLADSRAVAGFRPETKSMLYPIVGARAEGAHLIDVDGNRYVDIAMGFGVQLFGHSPAFLREALGRHLTERGLFLGPQAHLAGEVAQRICRLTGNDRAAFCNSGTEAVMTALRLARHATGRRRIAMFQGSYHGHFDGTLAQAGTGGMTVPLAGGTPPGMVDDILLLDYGDEEGSLEILAREGATLAAVLVEPVQGRRPDRQPRAFLQRLRTLTRDAGAALVFDEVLLGFRVALGGAQAWADVRADLVTYGKIIGGGLPIGVVAGDARFLDALDGGAWPLDGPGAPSAERTFFAGTFNKNPLAMASAQAVLAHLESEGPGLQESLNLRTGAFAARLNEMLAAEEAGISVHCFASLFRFVGASDLFYNHLIQNGVYVWEGRTCFLSMAHGDEDLDRVHDAVRASVRAMRAASLLPPARRAQAAQTGPERLPTTPGQAALRLLAAFSPETSAAYNQSLVFEFEGELDVDALQAALRTVVERHEALRTTFPEDGASQLVHAALAPRIQVIEAQALGQRSVQAWISDVALAPLDLEHGPLTAAWVLRPAADRARFVLVMPHLITDGWSMQVIALELAELYSARREQRAPALPEPVPYRRYADHNNARAGLPEAAAYWKSVYTTVPGPLELPGDRPRPPLQGYAGARMTRILPGRLRSLAEARGRQAGASLFSLCLAAYGRLLARLSGQDDVVVAIFSAGQPEVAASALVGYCVGVLPLRIAAGPAIADPHLLAQVQRSVAQGMVHRDYPFARLLKDLNLRRDPSRPPLASVSFNLDRIDAQPRFAGLSTAVDANVHGAVRWDLNWNMQADADGLRIDVHYNRDLFDAVRIESWLDAYAGILESLVSGEPDGRLATPAAPAAWRGALAGRVAETAARTPQAPAVVDRDGEVDYAGLDAMAAALAARLSQAGVRRGDRVAFRLAAGLGPVVAMLAAGRLGAAFVPLDEAHPPSHHAYVLQDSGARALVLQAGTAAPPVDIPVVAWSRGEPAAQAAAEPADVAPQDTAYVLYTSGSTGRPKGVCVSHGAVAAYVQAMLERLSLPGPVSFAIVSSFAADLGYTSVLGALWTGGALHAVDAETARDPVALQRWMATRLVDVLKIVPAHLAALLDAPGAAAMLPRRALILGGDVLAWRLVERIQALGAACRVFNHYGPTETTVGACMTEATPALREAGGHAVPVGMPLRGYDVRIVDAQGRPAPVGAEGEIVIGGAAVASGYTVPEAAGRERFFLDEASARCYRTGDIGRLRADGMVEFLGRGDDMVKIRGHRIEPAGLAELLRTHPQVRDAAVLVRREEGREPALLAAVAGEADAASLSAWLAQHVPAAMVPARIAIYAALPLTPNGKVDRQALLAAMAERADARPASGHAAVAPSMADEQPVSVIVDIWRAVLQRSDVEPDDDFFDLGGDSIMAIQIVGRARAAGLALTPAQVFQAPTPRGLARIATPVNGGVAGVLPVEGPVPLTPIQQWFLETPMPRRNRWCLTAVFAAPSEVSSGRLRFVLEAIVGRHDALRTCVDLDGWPPAQRVGPMPALCIEAFPAADGEALHAAQDDLADRLMDSLDLPGGRIIAAGVIPLADRQGAHIVVAVHHAVFDIVSWSVFADELESGLLHENAAMPPASTSWSWWAQASSRRVDAVLDRLPYWTDTARQAAQAAALPVDHADRANREGDVCERRLSLAYGGGDFLAGMATVFGLRPHEAILAAVGAALAEWAGAPVAVELEGHGRQAFSADIDLSRTMGWFTTRYPVVLPALDADLANWVVAFKEALRSVPDDGATYGLLRRGGHAQIHVEPEVSFNFVGDLGQYGARAMPLVRLGAGVERAPDAGRRHLLGFDAWQDEAGVTLSCRFAARHAVGTIDALLAAIEGYAQALAAACAASSNAVYTPSDFTGMEFSQDELDQLMGEFDEEDDAGTGTANNPRNDVA